MTGHLGRAEAPRVLKFGGSTFPDPGAYAGVAAALDDRLAAGDRPVAVVVSAMQRATESLRTLLHAVHPRPHDSTTAGVLTTADLTSAHLLAAALHRRGRTATVLAGHQLGMTTDPASQGARLRRTDPAPLRAALDRHEAVIIPGGQAVDEQNRITWLGKNSSDLTALAVAAALGAPACEIHSDVDGVYSGDPRLIRGAVRLEHLSYDTAVLLSRYGAGVLHRRAVSAAHRSGTVIVCRGNRRPYPVGSRVGPATAGRPASAVVVNTRSRVLRYPSAAAADRAYRAFRREGAETVRLSQGPLVALTAGYVDEEAVRFRNGLVCAEHAGVPVTVVRDGAVTTRIAPDTAHAVALAQRLHDRIVAPALRQPPPTRGEEPR